MGGGMNLQPCRPETLPAWFRTAVGCNVETVFHLMGWIRFVACAATVL